MSRHIPNILDHMGCLSNPMKKKIIAANTSRLKAERAHQIFSAVRLPKRDYDEVIEALRGSGFDVLRGVKIGPAKLLPAHPLSLSKNIPDVIKVKEIFTGTAKSCILNLESALPHLPRKKVHLFEKDCDLIERQLVAEGFDVSRGIKASGVEIIPLQGF